MNISFSAWDKLKKEMHHNVQFIKSGERNGDWIIFTSDKQPLGSGKVFDNPYPVQRFIIMQNKIIRR